MTPPRQFPGDFEGDDVWEQLTTRWERWQRQTPKAPIIVTAAVIAVLLGLWLATGFYTVGPGEQGVVRRFGKQVAATGPGLRYHWPGPIERVEIVNVEVVRRIELGFRSTPRYRQVPQESLMLTGDENIVEAQAIVQYRIKDPGAYLFRVTDPDQALRDATEVGLRSVIGRTTIEDVLTVGRLDIQQQTRDFMQHLLDNYEAGLTVLEVKLQVVDPPEQVKDAFHEVVRAREDRERLINEARGYQEDVIPKARGQAEQMIRAAEAYKAQRAKFAPRGTPRSFSRCSLNIPRHATSLSSACTSRRCSACYRTRKKSLSVRSSKGVCCRFCRCEIRSCRGCHQLLWVSQADNRTLHPVGRRQRSRGGLNHETNFHWCSGDHYRFVDCYSPGVVYH
jgi:membrane protease subunit HflK